MAKYFQIPFAMNGDRQDIPTDKQDDGSISFDEGYGADYEKNKQVDPTAKDISRQEFNSVLHDITGAIGEIQRSGVATWTNEISYNKGATIIHNGAVYTSTINANKNEPPHASWLSLDLSVYRKKDDLLFNGMMQVQATDDVGTGVFLLDKDGNPRGQMTSNSNGLQFTQNHLDGTSQTFTFPSHGGEILTDGNGKWALPEKGGVLALDDGYIDIANIKEHSRYSLLDDFDMGWRAPQQFTIYKNKMFMISNVDTNAGWSNAERVIITEWEFREGQSISYISKSKPLAVGHGSGLDVVEEQGKLYIYTTLHGESATYAGKGYSKILWRGGNTDQTDVEEFNVIDSGYFSNTNALELRRASTSLSDDKSKVFLLFTSVIDNSRYMIICDRVQVEMGNIKPLSFTSFEINNEFNLNIQSFTVVGDYIYSVCGNGSTKHPKAVQVNNLDGKLLGLKLFDGVSSYDGLVSSEPEGICFYEDILYIMQTELVRESGLETKSDKVVFGFNIDGGRALRINKDFMTLPTAELMLGYNFDNAILFPSGKGVGVNALDGDAKIPAMQLQEGGMVLYSSGKEYKLYYDGASLNFGREGTSTPVTFNLGEGSSDHINFKKAGDTIGKVSSTGSALELDSNTANLRVLVSREGWEVNANSNFRPMKSNHSDLGQSSRVIKDLYVSNQPNVTSDLRAKADVQVILERYLNVVSKLEFKQFKLKEGTSGRTHFGIIAQDWIEACNEVGVNPHESGVLVGSEEKGYAIRYGELQNLFNAYILTKLK